MTNRADSWLGDITPQQSSNQEVRSMDTARLIAAKPSVIIITRNGVQLSPQTMRVEVFHQASQQTGTNEEISIRNAIVVGYKNHPTIPDTDILRADRFFYNGAMYEVIDIAPGVPDRLLASVKVTP